MAVLLFIVVDTHGMALLGVRCKHEVENNDISGLKYKCVEGTAMR